MTNETFQKRRPDSTLSDKPSSPSRKGDLMTYCELKLYVRIYKSRYLQEIEGGEVTAVWPPFPLHVDFQVDLNQSSFFNK